MEAPRPSRDAPREVSPKAVQPEDTKKLSVPPKLEQALKEKYNGVTNKQSDYTWSVKSQTIGFQDKLNPIALKNRCFQ